MLLAKVVRHDVAKGTITYVEEDGSEETVPVTGGHCKLQWKPDMGMRWAALGVDYEMYGKDHLSQAPLYSAICKIAGGTPPEQYMYEMFLDDQGQKISKSKGNGISLDDWLTLWLAGKPGAVHVPEAAHRQAAVFRRDPQGGGRIYRLPGSLSCAGNHRRTAAGKSGLAHPWRQGAGRTLSGQLRAAAQSGVGLQRAQPRCAVGLHPRLFAGAVSPETNPGLDRLVGFALRYYEDFVKPAKMFRAADDKERAALEDLAAQLEELGDERDGKLVQNVVYEVGKAHGFEPLRAWFAALYEVLLGQTPGPALRLLRRPVRHRQDRGDDPRGAERRVPEMKAALLALLLLAAGRRRAAGAPPTRSSRVYARGDYEQAAQAGRGVAHRAGPGHRGARRAGR